MNNFLLEDLAGKMNMKLFQHSICAQGDVEIRAPGPGTYPRASAGSV